MWEGRYAILYIIVWNVESKIKSIDILLFDIMFIMVWCPLCYDECGAGFGLSKPFNHLDMCSIVDKLVCMGLVILVW